jgi:hypothetical protein
MGSATGGEFLSESLLRIVISSSICLIFTRVA